MSLIDDWKEQCVLVEKTRAPDGAGGFDEVWSETAPFTASIVLENSTQAVIAERQGIKKIYTVTTQKNAVLSNNDVFRRISDGETFRVTSDGKDVQTPASSAITPFSQVTAEQWDIPAEG